MSLIGSRSSRSRTLRSRSRSRTPIPPVTRRTSSRLRASSISRRASSARRKERSCRLASLPTPAPLLLLDRDPLERHRDVLALVALVGAEAQVIDDDRAQHTEAAPDSRAVGAGGDWIVPQEPCPHTDN